ncbi:hypothetical protein SAMN05444287_3061 [Octadecabacter temperatus]|uniref:Uncharacterized protein n=1 Tax=Octadecabacter temperatus TaxID=1458307 RepID=A0A0K0Y8K1_9RHOB|nr:hypothetical protein [Octadecabacter temperatus]AKS47298.1 hypothetical protein OSB_27740 [Octadecabacter temperatus]SIO44284.1 hypothetical protein SAMN05444287_3061 [Octadecabacter temperatus]
MPGRRVIVHAGFHKTGTTSAQKFLYANRKDIWPRCALALPGKLRDGAGLQAVRYSRFRTDALLDSFSDELHAMLSQIDPGRRKILISEESLSGRMPGRDGQLDYSATPTLMARVEDVICDVFGAEAEVIFCFTTREPKSWLKSTYKHNLRKSRLVMDEEEYASTFGPAADLIGVTKEIEKAVTGIVSTADLAGLTGPEGPAQPLVDLLELSERRRSNLTPHVPHNIGPKDEMIDELLALNRSSLSDKALAAAKIDLLGKAKQNDG